MDITLLGNGLKAIMADIADKKSSCISTYSKTFEPGLKFTGWPLCNLSNRNVTYF